jgi:subtilase family serine protease
MMNLTSRSLILALVCALLGLVPAGASAATSSANARTSAAGVRTSSAKLAIVLPLAGDTAGLERFATAVSTPGNPLYREYRSIAWLSGHFGASHAAEAKVVTYLRAHGATRVRVDATGLFVDATLGAARAAALFSTRLIRRGSRADAYTAPTQSVKIPSALKGTVTGVIGLNTKPVLATPSLQRSTTTTGQSPFSSLSGPITQDVLDPGSGYTTQTGTPAGCASGVGIGGFTPNEYLDAYGYNALQAAGTDGQGERVALIEVDGFKKSDVTTFASCFGLHVPKILSFRTDDQVRKAGLAPGGEATLDLEVLDAAAPDLSQIDVYESSADIASALESMTAPLQNSGYKPEVISASLGLCEPQVREAIGLAGMGDIEASLEEAAASGISMMAASGDDGSADCVDSDSADDLPLDELAVNFPASSPWVTAVGGTNLTINTANQIASEDVWNDDQMPPGASGGGGISNVFRKPGYQATVVPGDMRELPDVALLADIGPGLTVYCSARPECVSDAPGHTDPWQTVGGTSAATPLLAGGLAMIDQLLLAHHQQSLGLANPLLYAIGEDPAEAPLVYYDDTIGSNDVGPFISGDGEPLGCCTATVGFDDASGWGGINLSYLANVALTDSPAIVNVSESVNPSQKVVDKRAIYDTVSCSGACQIGAVVRISIGQAKPITLYSTLYHLSQAGSKLVEIPVTQAEETKLQAALKHHLKISVTVVGAIVDPAGNVERSTATQSVSIIG